MGEEIVSLHRGSTKNEGALVPLSELPEGAVLQPQRRTIDAAGSADPDGPLPDVRSVPMYLVGE